MNENLNGINCQNVLLGIGFCLAHPKYKECFKFDNNNFLEKIVEKFNLTKNKENPFKDVTSCESFLKKNKEFVSKLIVEYYISKLAKEIESDKNEQEEGYKMKYFSNLFNSYKDNNYNARDFLCKFKNIFTINYDPLIYFEMLRLKEQNINFADGFGGMEFKNAKSIYDKLDESGNKDNRKIFYLHGSWFIQRSLEEEKYRKISFGNKAKDNEEMLFDDKNGRFPHFILETDHQSKKCRIETDEYFKLCYEKFQKIEGTISVVGVSFEFDDHILTWLMQHKKLTKIYIHYINEDAKKSIEEKINEGKEKFEYKELNSNSIWQSKR